MRCGACAVRCVYDALPLRCGAVRRDGSGGAVRYRYDVVRYRTVRYFCLHAAVKGPNSSRSEERKRPLLTRQHTSHTTRTPEGIALLRRRHRSYDRKHRAGYVLREKRAANDYENKPTQVRTPLSTFTATTHSR